jgi:hypothetical protein
MMSDQGAAKLKVFISEARMVSSGRLLSIFHALST